MRCQYSQWETRLRQTWRNLSGDIDAGKEDRRLPWATALLILGIPIAIALFLSSR